MQKMKNTLQSLSEAETRRIVKERYIAFGNYRSTRDWLNNETGLDLSVASVHRIVVRGIIPQQLKEVVAIPRYRIALETSTEEQAERLRDELDKFALTRVELGDAIADGKYEIKIRADEARK